MLGPCVPSASAKQMKARKNNSFRRPARRQDSASVLWWQLSASPQRRWKAASCLNIIFCRRMPALSPAAGRDAAPSPSAPAVPARLEAPEAAPGALGGCPAPRAPLLPVLLWLGGWEGKEWRDAAWPLPGCARSGGIWEATGRSAGWGCAQEISLGYRHLSSAPCRLRMGEAALLVLGWLQSSVTLSCPELTPICLFTSPTYLGLQRAPRLVPEAWRSNILRDCKSAGGGLKYSGNVEVPEQLKGEK